MLDEVDQLETRHQEVLYTVFEWPALEGSLLTLFAGELVKKRGAVHRV